MAGIPLATLAISKCLIEENSSTSNWREYTAAMIASLMIKRNLVELRMGRMTRGIRSTEDYLGFSNACVVTTCSLDNVRIQAW